MDSAYPTRRAEAEDCEDPRPAALAPRGGIPHAIHAAANFSIDLLQEVVDSLGRDLGIGMSSAPFDHVLQSLYGQAGAPPEAARELLLLLSLEDWCRREELADHSACEAARAVGAKARFLPNGQQIMELHEYETDYLYGEIFDRADYLPSSIELPPAATVIDVGANIGMFSLFVLSHSPDARVIAVEPSPVTAKICAANLGGRGRAIVLQQGVGEQAGLRRFTHYEGATVFSGFHADVARDRKALEAAIQNEMRAHGGETAATLAAEFVGDRLNAVAADVQMTSISDLIDRHGLEVVDLLKIDAEHSEAAILRGIRAEHWPKIRQIVVETHDDDGDESGWIRRHLIANGFELSSAIDPHLENSGLSLLYAVRPTDLDERALRAPAPDLLGLRQRVEAFDTALRAFRARSGLPVHLIVGPYTGGGAASDHVRAQLDRAAEALRAACSKVPGVYLSDWEMLSAAYPVPSPAADEAAREVAIPYSPEWYAAAGAWALRHYAARHRLPHKMVAVDADNTLWQGACAELGIEGVELTPASLALQSKLKRLKEAGHLLVLISKNVPDDVWQVFEKRPEMLLNRDDFAAVEINWQAKSVNASAALQRLGLNADSLIFIDDNEIECAEVQTALPAALVIRFPHDRDEALAVVDHHWALDCVPGAIAIDRTLSARQEATRADVRQNSASFRAFVEGLGLEVRCETAALADVERLAELTRRTNQFNLHPQVQPEAVLRTRMENGSDRVWKVSARDKFGDYGIVGLIAASTAGSYCVDQFLLSCRALGRGVEQQMLLHVVRDAQALGQIAVDLHCRRTSRNEPAMTFVEAIAEIDEQRSLATIPADEAVQARLQDLDEWFAAKPSAEPVAAPRDTTLLDDRYRDDDWLLKRLQAAGTAKAIAGLVWPEYRGHGARIEGSEAEREVARIWENALGRSVAGIDVDFFSIGGTSLRLVQVIGELRRRGYRQLSIKEAYRSTTVRAMAAALGGRSTADPDRPPAPADAGEGDRDLSAPEQALWFEHQRNSRSALYVTVVPLLLERAPDPEAIRAAWAAVCAEHALLRTTYRLDGRRSVATPGPEPISAWRFLDSAIWDVPDGFDYVRRRGEDPIDLGRSPVGIDVLTLPDERCLIVLRIHHIVADFQSLSIILRAFGAKLADTGASAPEARSAAYAAFAAAAAPSPGGRARRPAAGVDDSGSPWWVKASRGSAPSPVAGSGPVVVVGRLPRPAEGGVAATAALHRVSPLSVLLAGFASFVHRESGLAELRVGTPVSLRDPATHRDTVGNFATLAKLALRDCRLPFDYLVQNVHRTIGNALGEVHASAWGEIAGDDVGTTFAYHEHLASDPILSLLPDGEVSAPFSLGPTRARLLGITPQVGLAPLGIDAFEDEAGLVIVLKCRAGTLARPAAGALMERLVRHLGQVLGSGRDGMADTGGRARVDAGLKAPSCI